MQFNKKQIALFLLFILNSSNTTPAAPTSGLPRFRKPTPPTQLVPLEELSIKALRGQLRAAGLKIKQQQETIKDQGSTITKQRTIVNNSAVELCILGQTIRNLEGLLATQAKTILQLKEENAILDHENQILSAEKKQP
jgi:hypothetical protein